MCEAYFQCRKPPKCARTRPGLPTGANGGTRAGVHTTCWWLLDVEEITKQQQRGVHTRAARSGRRPRTFWRSPTMKVNSLTESHYLVKHWKMPTPKVSQPRARGPSPGYIYVGLSPDAWTFCYNLTDMDISQWLGHICIR